MKNTDVIQNRGQPDTHSLILSSALKVISQHGYADATIKEIARQAGCNTLTIFRHFKDKESLFRAVIEHYYELPVDARKLDDMVTLSDLKKDFKILAAQYFTIIFQNLDILRIFVAESVFIHDLKLRSWTYPPSIARHFLAYLNRYTQNHNLKILDREQLSEIFVCFITRRVLEYNMHNGIKVYSEPLQQDFLMKNDRELNFIADLIS